MRTIVTLLFIAVAIGLVSAAPATPTVKTGEIADHRRVKLVSARISERRGQNLEAQFALEKDPQNAVVVSVTFPAHSHTTHETTLMNIIRASVSWSGRDEARHEWRTARRVPVFSLPADARRSDEFEQWVFLKFENPAAEIPAE